MKSDSRRNTREDARRQADKLKTSVIRNLRAQGFKVDRKRNLTPKVDSKDLIRDHHERAVRFLIDRSARLIKRYEPEFIQRFIANGDEVCPDDISPILIEIDDEYKASLFRWVKLHWSIPTSAGYGRRLRYLVIDEQNGKLIGIIGLGDPVFAVGDRDRFIGWTRQQRSMRLRNIMEAFVLGAVPPYSQVLGGKLVASLIASSEVSTRFREKYGGKKSLIQERSFDGTLAAITTTSALGRSSVYDRLNIPDGPSFLHVGWSSGSGEFAFINGDYQRMKDLVKRSKSCGKNEKWGSGTRSRRYVLGKALNKLELPKKLLYHGIKRELFIVPLGSNWREYLCGKTDSFHAYNTPVSRIAESMIGRWVVPRSQRDGSYINFRCEQYRLAGFNMPSKEGAHAFNQSVLEAA